MIKGKTKSAHCYSILIKIFYIKINKITDKPPYERRFCVAMSSVNLPKWLTEKLGFYDKRFLCGVGVYTMFVQALYLFGLCQGASCGVVRENWGFNQPLSTWSHTMSRPKWMFVSGRPKMGVWWWYQRPCLWKHHYLHVTPQSLPIVQWLSPILFPSPPVLISRTCRSSLSQPA